MPSAPHYRITQLPTFYDLEAWLGDSVTFTVRLTVDGVALDLGTVTTSARINNGQAFTVTPTGVEGELELMLEAIEGDGSEWALQISSSELGTITVLAGIVRVYGEPSSLTARRRSIEAAA